MARSHENLTRLIALRELKDEFRIPYQRSCHVTRELISRLGLQSELVGHSGCVNCLTWNEKGSLLASGSDDVQVIIWDPFRQKAVTTIRTGHNGNIFSVKFLPHSGDNIIVSAAADCRVRVHDVSAQEVLHIFDCHVGRVKRLATAPGQPNVFWSASEDGTVMEFDLREPESCKSDPPSNVLINLNEHVGSQAEVKCLSINPLRPELLAVGANDPYVRLYDRRMLHRRSVTFPANAPARFARSHFRSTSPDSSPPVSNLSAASSDEDFRVPDNCVTYFIAGHLPQKQNDYRRRYRPLASTYVTFNPNGNELLVNLGGEQIYLFDINKRYKPQCFDLAFSHRGRGRETAVPQVKEPSNGFHSSGKASNGVAKHIAIQRVGDQQDSNQTPPSKRTKYSSNLLPPPVEELKQRANTAFEQNKYHQAIILYNEALAISSNHAILYGNRAAAYLKRNWDGDVYAALRDCCSALGLDADHVKAHFRLARCLFELSLFQEALDCLAMFKVKFPDNAASKTCESLERDINAAISKSAAGDNASSSSSSSSSHRKESTSSDSISDQERAWRWAAYDYEFRFCGHCNTTTDIKEANFFGSNGQFIVAGSDDGSFFIWDKTTTNIVRVLRGDESIVNCLEPHPETCLLATSGIDPVVRLWSPLAEDGQKNEREINNPDEAACANQRRMNADPLEVMLSNMGYRITGFQDDDDASGDRDTNEGAAVSCRPS